MTVAWTKFERGYRFASDELVVVFESENESLPRLVATLPGSNALSATVESFCVSYESSNGKRRKLAAKAGRDVVQDENLQIGEMLESTEGVQLAACFRIGPGCVDAEFELLTVGEINDLTLETDLCVTNGCLQAIETMASQGESRRLIAAAKSAMSGNVIVFADLGDDGEAEIQQNKSTLRFFRRSLEKGVVLVARLSLRAKSGDVCPDSLMQSYGEWSAQRRYL